MLPIEKALAHQCGSNCYKFAATHRTGLKTPVRCGMTAAKIGCFHSLVLVSSVPLNEMSVNYLYCDASCLCPVVVTRHLHKAGNANHCAKGGL